MTQPHSTDSIEYKYPGTPNLVMMEMALMRYNGWVVDKFIRAFAERNKPDARVLDFGAGLGTLSKLFHEKTGIHPDAFEIDAAHRDEIAKHGFTSYADIRKLPGGYDLIFSSNVLEHIDDDAGILRTIHTHLRPNGMLLVYVPAFMVLWTTMDEIVGHVRRYSRRELCAKLREAGYTIEYTGYCDSVGFVLSYIFKYLDRKTGEMPLRSLRLYDKFFLPVTKITDIFCRHLFGKNLYVIAKKAG